MRKQQLQTLQTTSSDYYCAEVSTTVFNLAFVENVIMLHIVYEISIVKGAEHFKYSYLMSGFHLLVRGDQGIYTFTF